MRPGPMSLIERFGNAIVIRTPIEQLRVEIKLLNRAVRVNDAGIGLQNVFMRFLARP
jgi:hypothetical protein